MESIFMETAFVGISQEKWKPESVAASAGQRGRALLKILYRAPILVALACVVALVPWASGQEDRAQVPTLPRKAQPVKKNGGPRALAALLLSSNGKASLVPICILINGKFWDATAYKADPVPFALDTGTIYEAERTGNSLGLFTVGSALHSNAANASTPWLGTGAWVPAGTEKTEMVAKAEAVPVGIGAGDGPPRLTKDPAKMGTPPDAAPASTPTSAPAASSESSPASSPSSSGSSSGDDPPRLKRPPPDPEPASNPSATKPADTKSADTKSADTKPAETKPNDTKPSDTATSTRPRAPESDSGADTSGRPRLRRGKPTEPLPDDAIPGYSKAGTTPPANAGKIVASTTASGPVQLFPAISDAGGPEPHSFTFEWLKDEEGERKQQMMDLAKQELRSYLDTQAKNKIPQPPPVRRKPGAKPPQPIFGTVQMIAYDLWTNNRPVVVFSAEAHMPAPAGATDDSENLQYSILLVTYPDIYNNMHKLYAAVTDPHHLDIMPRLELVDAVDADGDGRGELLFRQTSDQGTGWVIYRATADKLWKMFDSLNPE
jgi:hypothetical protein